MLLYRIGPDQPDLIVLPCSVESPAATPVSITRKRLNDDDGQPSCVPPPAKQLKLSPHLSPKTSRSDCQKVAVILGASEPVCTTEEATPLGRKVGGVPGSPQEPVETAQTSVFQKGRNGPIVTSVVQAAKGKRVGSHKKANIVKSQESSTSVNLSNEEDIGVTQPGVSLVNTKATPQPLSITQEPRDIEQEPGSVIPEQGSTVQDSGDIVQESEEIAKEQGGITQKATDMVQKLKATRKSSDTLSSSDMNTQEPTKLKYLSNNILASNSTTQEPLPQAASPVATPVVISESPNKGVSNLIQEDRTTNDSDLIVQGREGECSPILSPKSLHFTTVPPVNNCSTPSREDGGLPLSQELFSTPQDQSTHLMDTTFTPVTPREVLEKMINPPVGAEKVEENDHTTSHKKKDLKLSNSKKMKLKSKRELDWGLEKSKPSTPKRHLDFLSRRNSSSPPISRGLMALRIASTVNCRKLPSIRSSVNSPYIGRLSPKYKKSSNGILKWHSQFDTPSSRSSVSWSLFFFTISSSRPCTTTDLMNFCYKDGHLLTHFSTKEISTLRPYPIPTRKHL